ncbi:RNA-directed DNA polymerase [Vibrio fluvialis]|nr:RNA-directed DNA polymerase [Vibrio fluvialis]
MFDQSFSVKNFRKIYDIDRRTKGSIESDHFPDAYKVRIKIINLKRFLKRLSKKRQLGRISENHFQMRKKLGNDTVTKRKEQYNKIVDDKITEIVNVVGRKDYSLSLSKIPNQVSGKDVFTIGSDVESIFVSKHIQRILKYLFNVKISHRDLIISRLSSLVQDKSPKYIIRADVENFYESIDHKMLLSILHSSPKLSVTPRRVITQLIRSFKSITGQDKGLPRGVGLSSYLSEVYMNDLDERIKSLHDEIYYERYVDDIILVFSPTKSENIPFYINKLNYFLDEKKLKANNKTEEINLYHADNGSFDYLGYNFNVSSGGCTIKLSRNKCDKIKARISKTFEKYDSMSSRTPKKASKFLLLRIRFLTGNTRLHNSKSKAFVGIYFSNKHINNITDLIGLDRFMMSKASNLQDIKLKRRIAKLSFKEGFEKKIFRNFTIKELSELSKVWKNV